MPATLRNLPQQSNSTFNFLLTRLLLHFYDSQYGRTTRHFWSCIFQYHIFGLSNSNLTSLVPHFQHYHSDQWQETIKVYRTCIQTKKLSFYVWKCL